MNPRALTLSAVLFLLASLITWPAVAATLNGIEILTGEWHGEEIEYLEGEILIGLNPGETQADFSAAIAGRDVEIVRPADRFGFLKLRTDVSEGFFELIHELEQLRSVRYAEPNMVDHLFVIPNDPEFYKQWHYHNTGQTPPGGTPDADIDAPEAWGISTGAAYVKVGILDSGIPMQEGALSHPDLDDPTRFFPGLDISNGDSEPMDDNGHGTHVAGTIGAETDNAIGVAGVAWNVQILCTKVFNRYGSGSHENFRDGCIYSVDSGCKVINYSGGGSDSETKEHGVAYADSHGVVVCASAGNSYQGSVSWPGAYSLEYSNVICVSSTDHNDGSSPFSSIGPEVTISSPGGYGSPFDEDDVWSTMPNYEVQLNLDYGLPQNYGPLAGTSMAAPHVTGLVALILSVNPELSPDSVRQVLINTSDDLGPAGFDNQFGWGRINAFNALSQMKLLAIVHEPLPDTKDTLNDYEVLCRIYSDTSLTADSLLLYYQIAPIWYEDLLLPTGGDDEYRAYIPAQSPGTEISYYLFARNDRGDYDSTTVHDFRVIDYAVSLSPEFQGSMGAVDDTVWYTFSLVNEGIYIDSFAVQPNFWVWPTKIWDASGAIQINTIGPLLPDEQYDFLVSVEVPPSFYGDVDSALIRASSKSSLGVFAQAWLQTTSAGQPLTVPFIEEFETPGVNIGKWLEHSGVEVNEVGINEPSEPYSLNLNGDPSGGDYLMSQPINLGGLSGLNISYFYQQTGGGESPDIGDDLFIEYMNNLGQWLPLNQHDGGDADMVNFEAVTMGVPVDGYHSGFRLRISNSGSEGPYDDWFVDNIRIDWGPAISVSPESYSYFLDPGDSAADILIVDNAGPGWLSYAIGVTPDYSSTSLFGYLAELGRVNPARYDTPDGWEPVYPVKGGDEGLPGPEVVYDAGGPDNYGYVWIDSDEPNGPAFNWIDVLATGTDITSGLDDDNFVGPYPIGFDFPYYDGSYSEFYFSANGFIGFGPTTGYGSLSNVSMPNTAAPNNIIAWCWDDLDPTDSDAGEVKVVFDNAGGGCVIQVHNYPEYSANPGDVINAEIILYPNGSVLLQYLTIAPGFDILNCTVGIENQAGADGLQVAHNSSYLHDSLALKFIKPAQWLYLSSLAGELPPEQADTITLRFITADLDTGWYRNDITISSNDPDPVDNPIVVTAELYVSPGEQYLCGDADANDLVNVSDAVYVISYVFAGGPAPEPVERADVDCNEAVNVSDAVYLLAFIFAGGPQPCADCP